MDLKYKSVLEEIINYFGVGKIYEIGNKAYFRVTKVDDLINIVIPHFNSFPLISRKQVNFKV